MISAPSELYGSGLMRCQKTMAEGRALKMQTAMPTFD